MTEHKIYETKIGEKKVTIEVGKYAQQSDGSCIIRCQDTVVMLNVNVANQAREGVDFLPLSVDYEEKMYAVGKIPGGFKRREGKASDGAILVSRLIDRPLRPLFPKGFYNDVTVVATVLSVDPDCSPEPLAMLGSSIALCVSSAPLMEPTGSAVVGLVDDQLIINPDAKEREKSSLYLTVSGTKDAIMMVEAGADEVTEEKMIEAILFAHKEIKKQVTFQEKIISEVGKPKYVMPNETPEVIALRKVVREYATPLIRKAIEETDNDKRNANVEAVNKEIQEHFAETYPNQQMVIGGLLYKIAKETVRYNTVNKERRIDGRKYDEIRPIWCEVGLLPRVHGSAIFTRGKTQALTTVTLGTFGDMQKLEGLDEEVEKRYMHHYNMPPYASGEVRSLKNPGRREIGHGALAERAIEPVIPSEEEFPYAIRAVSEILSSNGSTSQAAVCGSCLALMDAGVPIRSPVSGIAMGLMKDEATGKVIILSDIQGEEDFFGDMDFKVAGTPAGITAIQMDIKIKGIDKEILTRALTQAKEGRAYILGKMMETLDKPRAELSVYAPKIMIFNIDPEKIGDVVGKSGKTINKIIAETGVTIDIADDGKTTIATQDFAKGERAKQIILDIVTPVEKGKQYEGTVARIMSFGAFVEFAFNKDGMVHISKLSDKRVEKVEDVVKIGDKVKVEVLDVDDKGRVNLKLVEKY